MDLILICKVLPTFTVPLVFASLTAAFFTVTLQVAFFPLEVFAVMVAVPAFLAVTLPLELTVATFLLEEVQVIFSVAEIGFLVTANVALFPFNKVIFLLLKEMLLVVTLPFCTCTVQLAFAPLLVVTVTVALPVLLVAVSFPLESTLTIFVLDDFQDATESPFALAASFDFRHIIFKCYAAVCVCRLGFPLAAVGKIILHKHTA